MLSLAHNKAGLRQKLKVALIIYYIACSGEKRHVVKMSFFFLPQVFQEFIGVTFFPFQKKGSCCMIWTHLQVTWGIEPFKITPL